MKAILPAAGLGTRLLPATKEQPKEMLSLFCKGENDQLCVKPLLQLVFEQLHDAGFEEFCFVVGRGKRSIEDHFTPDNDYVELMHDQGKDQLGKELWSFYEKVKNSKIVWVNQPEPRGFGDAVLKARNYADDDRILVHAGDTYIISHDNSHLDLMVRVHEDLNSEATLLLQEVEDPRMYGVVEAEGTEEDGVYEVKNAIEKPDEPPTNLAVMPVYIFEPSIFDVLERTPPGKGDEIQLTDGFVKLIEEGKNVNAVKLEPDEIRWDIGTAETYWEALKASYRFVEKDDF
ncbi:hypothetical protein AKJ45_00325 [candidate division MSBL1 archaeon SCGC-AAA261F19]|uniref:UTP--glucose-1-phosphate uridylyltransferase n=1 Tax=candidate division MSBL1 archaeon SCGC-AAA261F19 TaxID=1698275 RepID=A0A133VBQ1_9EURY|nr:hypothetical protein AKJ45_00325 [candidate division MSBL1 archaeon SCGC-AAA261F19]